MATLEQQTERNLPARMGPGLYFNGWCRCCLAFLVSWLLFAGFVSLAADPYAVLLEEQFAPEPQADNPVPPSENAASNLNISQLENALITKGQSMSRRRQVSPPSVTSRTDISLASAVLLAAAILIPNLATFLRPRLNAWFPVPAKSADSSVNVLADEPSLAEFFAMLRAGPDLPLAGHTA